jgi:zinc ribbon protein
MLILGAYHFRPRRLAFRNDYCLSCGKTQRAVQVRTFEVVHLFWIPIVPLGFWKRWICTTCNRQPHINTKSLRPFKWAVLVMLVLASAVSWAFPISASDSVVGSWMFRIGGPLGVLLILVHLIRTPQGPSRKELLRTVQPATDTICPFCGTQMLALASQCSCPTCGIIRA